MQAEERLPERQKANPETIPSQNSDSTEDQCTAYAEAVIAGEIVAGPYVRAQCARHIKDLSEARKRGLYWDLAGAQRVIRYFKVVLRLNGGQFEGLPFVLEPAQCFIIGSIFGWKRKDGTRRFRAAYIEMGKGNGKSPLVAGIGHYCMVSDDEPRAEIYAAATKRDQAMVLYRDAVAMMEQSPALSRRLTKSGRDDKVWNMFDSQTNSFYRPISADDGQSGPRPHVGLIDELHEHKKPTVLNMMSAGKKWRRQPLVVSITNSGTDRKGVCWENRSKAIQVAQGLAEDDTLFPYVCAMDEGDDPFEDESCWIKANPLLGTIITKEYLRDEVNSSRGMPSKTSTTKRLNFCIWTESENPFIGYDQWKAAEEDYTLERFRGMTAFAGIDLSAIRDLTAIVLVFFLDGVYWTWPMFWIPEEGIAERDDKDQYPYQHWVEEGHVYTTPGPTVDKDFVVAKAAEVLGEFDITLSQAPFDRWRIDVLQAALDRNGIDWPLEPFGQGFASMAPAIDELETALVSGNFRHPGNPCMNINAANAVVAEDPAGNRKLAKNKTNRGARIDGMIATTMAVGVASGHKEEKPKEFQMMVLN